MASTQFFLITLVLGLFGYSYGMSGEGNNGIPDERLLGYGLGGIGGYGTYGLGGLGGYGGYGGLGYGGVGTLGYGGLGGYGLGGLGYGRGGLIYDEDPSAENDEFQDEAMTSKGDYKTVIIPGHKIRKLKVQLYKKHGEESAVDHATTTTGSSNMETMPTENKSSNENVRVIRVPHHIFRRLMHQMREVAEVTPITDNSATESNVDSNIDVDNTQEEASKWKNWKGVHELRHPHHIKRDKENSMIRVVTVPRHVYKGLNEFADGEMADE
ncbi:aspartate, glycine, lysine and serine-rich protein-like [Paramacrobiotus metropolitanus]|uniref:aspartate, glycine, lysine and serine-rich protein-like n=1 Tax=Paramacrobiotus metropolitanus TaxID=2943436 RepID=UPI002446202D|nr:aspartate, glycine, lysine and serine-rich protein-like [Paramacrobiotus metropolitanus]